MLKLTNINYQNPVRQTEPLLSSVSINIIYLSCNGPKQIIVCYRLTISNQNQIKKFYLKSVHFITIQHKLSRAFQTDMHNKLHKSTWSIYYWLNRICSDTLYIVYFFPKHRKVKILHFLGYKTLTLWIVHVLTFSSNSWFDQFGKWIIQIKIKSKSFI
jgi:hypothetical protein